MVTEGKEETTVTGAKSKKRNQFKHHLKTRSKRIFFLESACGRGGTLEKKKKEGRSKRPRPYDQGEPSCGPYWKG